MSVYTARYAPNASLIGLSGMNISEDLEKFANAMSKPSRDNLALQELLFQHNKAKHDLDLADKQYALDELIHNDNKAINKDKMALALKQFALEEQKMKSDEELSKEAMKNMLMIAKGQFGNTTGSTASNSTSVNNPTSSSNSTASKSASKVMDEVTQVGNYTPDKYAGDFVPEEYLHDAAILYEGKSLQDGDIGIYKSKDGTISLRNKHEFNSDLGELLNINPNDERIGVIPRDKLQFFNEANLVKEYGNLVDLRDGHKRSLSAGLGKGVLDDPTVSDGQKEAWLRERFTPVREHLFNNSFNGKANKQAFQEASANARAIFETGLAFGAKKEVMDIFGNNPKLTKATLEFIDDGGLNDFTQEELLNFLERDNVEKLGSSDKELIGRVLGNMKKAKDSVYGLGKIGDSHIRLDKKGYPSGYNFLDYVNEIKDTDIRNLDTAVRGMSYENAKGVLSSLLIPTQDRFSVRGFRGKPNTNLNNIIENFEKLKSNVTQRKSAMDAYSTILAEATAGNEDAKEYLNQILSSFKGANSLNGIPNEDVEGYLQELWNTPTFPDLVLSLANNGWLSSKNGLDINSLANHITQLKMPRDDLIKLITKAVEGKEDAKEYIKQLLSTKK